MGKDLLKDVIFRLYPTEKDVYLKEAKEEGTTYTKPERPENTDELRESREVGLLDPEVLEKNIKMKLEIRVNTQNQIGAAGEFWQGLTTNICYRPSPGS